LHIDQILVRLFFVHSGKNLFSAFLISEFSILKVSQDRFILKILKPSSKYSRLANGRLRMVDLDFGMNLSRFQHCIDLDFGMNRSRFQHRIDLDFEIAKLFKFMTSLSLLRLCTWSGSFTKLLKIIDVVSWWIFTTYDLKR